MLIQPWKMSMISLIIFGSILTMSSPSWMGMWMGLEINLMGIIPMLISEKNARHSEASLKYFLVQALGSSILIFAFLLHSSNLMESFMITMVMISMMIKSGIAPFHFWIPPVTEGLKYTDLLLILTWQKVAPMSVLLYMMPEFNTNILMTSIFLSVTLGAIGGFNQTSNRKILAYSSIAHSGWMVSALLISFKMWTLYMIIYSTVLASLLNLMLKLNMNKILQNTMMQKNSKTSMMISILSLGGLPPFLGFLPKLMVINQMYATSITLTYTMMMCALLTLFYYLRMTYSMMMIHYMTMKSPMKLNLSINQILTNLFPILLMIPILLN